MFKLKKILKELFPYTRKNWSVFVLCVIISCIFWLFLTFSGKFESELEFKINYEGFPKNKILINEPISKIKLKVNARGFALLKHSFLDVNKEIVLNADDFTLLKKGTLFCYSLSNTSKNKIIKDKLAELFKINDFPNVNVELYFDDVIQKTVAVIPVFKIINDSSLYQITKTTFSVDSIQIKGSKSLINKVTKIETEAIKIPQLKQNTSIYLPVRRAKGVLEMSPDSIALNIEVAPIKQFSINVPLYCVDCPSNVQLKLFPSSAKVTFNCSESEFQKIKSLDFKLSVNYAEVNPDSDKLFIHLEKFPNLVNNIKISPAKADYLIRLK